MSGTHDGSAFDYTDPGVLEVRRDRERIVLVGVRTAVLEQYARDNGIDADDYTTVVRAADVRRLADRDRTYMVVERGDDAREVTAVGSLIRALEGAGKVAKPYA